MFRRASLSIVKYFAVAVFNIFVTLNVDSIVGFPQKNIQCKNFDPHKKLISLLNVPICTQGMQRTWWQEAGTIIVTGPFWDIGTYHAVVALYEDLAPARSNDLRQG